jgi:uncharacterized membrane protein
MENNVLLTIEELKSRRKSYLESLTSNKNKISRLDKIAIWITKNVGSMRFFLIILVWTVCWLGWNMLSPKYLRFDLYPAFVLWLFISNLIQLFLMPLILIGQNLQSSQADFCSETDLKVNMLAALENETILSHLEYQNKVILQILKKLE